MKYFLTALAIATVAGVTLTGGARVAHGELVFEDQLKANGTDAGTFQGNQAGNDAPQARSEERKDLSKSEMLRRQRLREELKNEDLLTTKLEELRLKDEMKRTDQLLGSGVNKEQEKPAPIQELRVGSAAVETPAAMPASAAVAPVPLNPAVNTAAIVSAQVQPGAQTSMATVPVLPNEEGEMENNRVSITPRIGISNITNSANTFYEISSKYSLGGDISVDVTDHIAFTAGYTYSAYLLSAGSAFMAPAGYKLQQLQLNDNSITAGMRGYLLGMKSRVRPFIGGGVGYRKGFINYDEAARRYFSSPDTLQDVEISGFSGNAEAGLEFRLSKSLSLVGSFRYFTMLSSSQNVPVNANGFINAGMVPGGYYYGGLSPYASAADYQKYQAADSLAKNSFYQLMAGVSLSF